MRNTKYPWWATLILSLFWAEQRHQHMPFIYIQLRQFYFQWNSICYTAILLCLQNHRRTLLASNITICDEKLGSLCIFFSFFILVVGIIQKHTKINVLTSICRIFIPSPTAVYWRNMTTLIGVNIDLWNGLLPKGIKTLPRPMLAYRQYSPVI